MPNANEKINKTTCYQTRLGTKNTWIENMLNKYVCVHQIRKNIWLFEVFKVCVSLVLLTQDSLEKIMSYVINHFVIVHN